MTTLLFSLVLLLTGYTDNNSVKQKIGDRLLEDPEHHIKDRAVGNKLAFVLDNRLLQVAMVNSQITGGVTALNRGDYSRQELENFKTIIESEK